MPRHHSKLTICLCQQNSKWKRSVQHPVNMATSHTPDSLLVPQESPPHYPWTRPHEGLHARLGALELGPALILTQPAGAPREHPSLVMWLREKPIRSQHWCSNRPTASCSICLHSPPTLCPSHTQGGFSHRAFAQVVPAASVHSYSRSLLGHLI